MDFVIQPRVMVIATALICGLIALTSGFGNVQAAGSVLANTSYGDLVITGSQQDDEIVIKRVVSGGNISVSVAGRNGTTVNGSSNPVFFNVNFGIGRFNRNLVIDMQGGDDAVFIGELQNGTSNPVQPTAILVSGDLDIMLGDGGDTLAMQAVEVTGDVQIMTGNGNDYMDDAFSHMHRDFTLNLGNGYDQLLMQYTRIDGNACINAVDGNGCTIPGGNQGLAEQDMIELIQVTVGSDLDILTGAGVDGVTLTGVAVTGSASLDTGDHRDGVAIDGVNVGELHVWLGGGDDEMEVRKSRIELAHFICNPVDDNGVPYDDRGKDKLFLMGNSIEALIQDDGDGCEGD